MNINNANPYKELEERTLKFAEDCKTFTLKLPKNVQNSEYIKQLIRSSGSQAANYIEANEGFSRKDKLYRFKICRKETKESKLWLHLCTTNNNVDLDNDKGKLIREAEELRRIFTSIIVKYL